MIFANFSRRNKKPSAKAKMNSPARCAAAMLIGVGQKSTTICIADAKNAERELFNKG